MIHHALDFLREQLNTWLVSAIEYEMLDDRVVLSNIVQSGSLGDMGEPPELVADRILLSLIHVEEERIFKSQNKTVVSGNTTQFREPTIKINLFILFASHFTDYFNGLEHLSETISFFQANNIFDPADYPSMKANGRNLDRMVIDLNTPSIDQNYEFWQSLGGKFLPSVMYKIRILFVQKNNVQAESPAIEEGLPILGQI